jgi:cation diffusion facilitator CzcD-associated flavoprotein CzcO
MTMNGSEVDVITNGNGVAHTVDAAFRNSPAYKPRKLRVVTIGAGYSGLTLAHKFQHQHPELQDYVDHTIYETRSELGGTWLVNTYPGVVCDVPSHIYVRPLLWLAFDSRSESLIGISL